MFHKLADVVQRELGLEMDKSQQRADWAGEITAEMKEYAAEDSRVLPSLVETLETKIEATGLKKVAEIEHRSLPALVWLSGAGVPFDSEGWRQRLGELDKDQETLKEKLTELAPEKPDGGFWNWNSSVQILKAFELVGVNLEDAKAETLCRHELPLTKTLLSYKEVSKMLSTYGNKLLEQVEEERIYASWRQMGAGTGRMACSSPNLQNLPPEVRGYVRAPEDRMLVRADYSQIELRIAARISGDERMLEAFAAGEDIHTITARSLTSKKEVTKEERKLAKAVNFGLLFGMKPAGFRHYARNNYGVEMSVGQAERYWRDFFETYPTLKAWHDEEYLALKKGSTETRTLSGRRRTGVAKFPERLNSPVQGTGADGIKLALALLWERRGECPGATPILVVHDEIVIECDEDRAGDAARWLEKSMVDGMEDLLNAPDLEGPHVPVEVDTEVGKTWVN